MPASLANTAQRFQKAKTLVEHDHQQFHWTQQQYRDAANGTRYKCDDRNFRTALYRPFFKQHLYFDHHLNWSMRRFPDLFPTHNSDNLGIAMLREGTNKPFHTLMTDNVVEYHFTGDTTYLPRYRYKQSEVQNLADFHNDGLELVSNINPAALLEFRQHYHDTAISEDDVFYYTYGVLHSQQWRDIFANDLTKSAARIPMAASLDAFCAFVDAGRQLSDLHVNYETVESYPLEEIHSSNWNPNTPDAYRVQKMKYAGKRPKLDTSTIIYNAGISLKGIPDIAHEYKLGTRSALDWLIDRYQIRTHNKSGIVNDPNDWAAEAGEPRYILDLIKRVTTVSVRTVEIVRGLPELPI